MTGRLQVPSLQGGSTLPIRNVLHSKLFWGRTDTAVCSLCSFIVTFRRVKLNVLAITGDFRKAVILTTQFKPCIMLLVTNKAIGQLVNKLDFCLGQFGANFGS